MRPPRSRLWFSFSYKSEGFPREASEKDEKVKTMTQSFKKFPSSFFFSKEAADGATRFVQSVITASSLLVAKSIVCCEKSGRGVAKMPGLLDTCSLLLLLLK